MNLRVVRVVCWLALLAGVVVFSRDGANAQGSEEAQQACTGDAMRLCADAIPDVPKVTACMKAKYAQLSPPCRLVMGGGGGGGGRHVAHPAPRYRVPAGASHCNPHTQYCS
jgi:hypothetical protein